MQLTHLIVGAQIAERMREADEARLGRLARRNSRRAEGTAWSYRTRRVLGNRLVAVGEALRRTDEKRPVGTAVNRPT